MIGFANWCRITVMDQGYCRIVFLALTDPERAQAFPEGGPEWTDAQLAPFITGSMWLPLNRAREMGLVLTQLPTPKELSKAYSDGMTKQ